MEKELLYEGKAKKIYAGPESDQVVLYYKDDATAFNGVKKSEIRNKGILNNRISTLLFQTLEEKGIKTHFLKTLDDRRQLCRKVSIIPLEVIVRNIITGSMAKRLALEEGLVPEQPVYELCYKDDDLGDPLINDHHAVALKAATFEELKVIYGITQKINELLRDILDREGILLVDFKIEFGKTLDGEILLADEITPDTCRLWDKETKKKLDKDRFRRDLGGVEEAYMEILKRLSKEG